MESIDQTINLHAEPVNTGVSQSGTSTAVDSATSLVGSKLDSLQQELLQAISQSQCVQDAARSLASVASRELESLQLWFCQRGESSGQVMLDALLDFDLEDLIESSLPDLHLAVDQVVEETLQTGKLVFSNISCGLQLVSTPVFFMNQRPAAFVTLCFGNSSSVSSECSSDGKESSLASSLRSRTTAAVLQLTSSYLTLWQTQHAQSQNEGTLAKLLSSNLREIMSSTSRVQACSLLCTRLSSYFHASHVALFAVQSLGHVRLAGFSGTTEVDRSSQLHQALHNVCVQIASSDASFDTCRSTDEGVAGKLLLQTSQLLNQSFGLASEVRNNGQLVGVVVLIGDQVLERNTLEASFAARLATVSDQLSCSLHWHQSPLQRWTLRTVEIFKKWKWWIVGSAAVFSGLGLMPFPYQMNCDCRLATTHKRFVVAPFVGCLAEVMIEPGSLVEENQVLARMDDRDLRLERIGKVSEYDREVQKSQTARAAGNMAEAKIAELESQRIQQQINLIDNRLQHQEIRSPIFGTVVQGDLRELQGAPVELGQNLFEVAPLDTLVVEIALPEYQYRYAAVDQEVSLYLDAYPFDTWTGIVAGLKPQAEVRDGQNVFIAEVVIENKEALLRPGMKGQAIIKGESYPLVWNWLHYPYEKARSFFRWF